MAEQLPLNIKLEDYASFDNFFAESNQELISSLHHSLSLCDDGFMPEGEAWFLYLWGKTSFGKTHLLHAACRVLQGRGVSVQYLPLSNFDELDPDILLECSGNQVVCLDDLECLSGNSLWESRLFSFMERRRESRSLTIASAAQSPVNIDISLPDLMTRLAGWGLVYALHGLNDKEKMVVLQERAQRRGLELADDVARYILDHFPRGMEQIYQLLDKIDEQSLVSKRKVTIPFLRNLQKAE